VTSQRNHCQWSSVSCSDFRPYKHERQGKQNNIEELGMSVNVDKSIRYLKKKEFDLGTKSAYHKISRVHSYLIYDLFKNVSRSETTENGHQICDVESRGSPRGRKRNRMGVEWINLAVDTGQ
jgi:hypothetical protein